jgi:hypothetical protein
MSTLLILLFASIGLLQMRITNMAYTKLFWNLMVLDHRRR